MQFSVSTGYGLLAVDYIAKNQDHIITSQTISEEYSISLEILEKILQILVKADILREVQGPTISFSLARQSEQISMLEIIEAIEGPIFSELNSNGFAQSDLTKEIYEKGLAEIKNVLKKTKLSDML